MQRKNKQIEYLKKLVNLAKIAEQAERYDDLIKYMKQYVENAIHIKIQEMVLCANGFKCKVNAVRTAWRAISALQFKQTNSKSRSSAIIQYYKEKLQKQIREISQEIIYLVNSCINKDIKCDEKVKFFYHKIKGDYQRYLCEVAKDQELKKLQKQCENSYLKALNMIEQSEIKQAMKTDAIKLGVSLNLSVFYYQICNNGQKALQVCQKSFNQALQAISDLQDNRFTDVVTIMQLMHDNLTQWKVQFQGIVK